MGCVASKACGCSCVYLFLVLDQCLSRVLHCDINFIKLTFKYFTWWNIFQGRCELAIVNVGAIQNPNLLLLNLQIKNSPQIFPGLPALHFNLTVGLHGKVTWELMDKIIVTWFHRRQTNILLQFILINLVLVSLWNLCILIHI